MFEDDYGRSIPSRANNLSDMIAMTDIGGIGTLIYHTFRFKDYECDEAKDGTDTLAPIVYEGMEPDFDQDNSVSGATLVMELYNMAKRADSFDEERSFALLMIVFCKEIAHPYDIDWLYEYLSDGKVNYKRDGKRISEEAMFPVAKFKRDIENFYYGARYYFALRKIADGEDYDIKEITEDGAYFDGVRLLTKYPRVVMPVADEKYDSTEEITADKLIQGMEEDRKAYEKFLKEHKKDLYKYERDDIDDFYKLRDGLLDIIPDFHMRLKANPKNGNVTFAADVHSVFDIAWYTLARYMADVKLVDDGTKEIASPDGKVCVCKCCGRAFVRRADQNRKLYCGEPECERKRNTMRTRRKREKDKIAAEKSKKQVKKTMKKT